MTKTILAFDELDGTLGSFFLACKQELDTFFEEKQVTTTQLNSAKLNELAIEFITENAGNFIFGAYSHGGHDCLVKGARIQDTYISNTANGHRFKNSFFYTFSCSSGKKLGAELVDSGCLCFIGYKNDVAIWSTYTKPFITCANHGLIKFFAGFNTKDIIVQMKEQYDAEIDAVYQKDFLIASILRENRDSLIFHGKGVKLDDFS